jgi:serpin B
MVSVEPLEPRQFLAADAVWEINAAHAPGSSISVTAVPGKEGLLRVSVNGTKVGARRVEKVGGIRIRTGDGNDLVRVRLDDRFAELPTTVLGGAGRDVLIGGASRDVLRGGPGNDRLDGRGNADFVKGGPGADRIRTHGLDEDTVRDDPADRFVDGVVPRIIEPASQPPEPEPAYPPYGSLPEPQPLDDSPATTVNQAINRFAFATYRKLVEQKRQENILFSPSSLATMLSMLLPAARGRTLEQMLSALRLPPDVAQVLRQFSDRTAPVTGDPPYAFTNANAIWHDPAYPLLDDYRLQVQDAFRAVVDELDLADAEEAERVVDRWAALHTQGMINDIVDPNFFTATMRVVLANAVYFKGNWVEKFDPVATYDQTFYRADGTTVQVPMMNRSGGFSVYHGTGFRMAILPYEGDRFSMLLLLPDRYDAADELASVITPALLDQWVAEAEEASWYRLAIPKFELSTRLESGELISLMGSLGMTDVFSAQTSDLTGMTGRAADGLHLEKLVHAARIEVNEEGTRAAAVTVGGGGVCSGPPTFTVDRPFILAIRDDQTGAIEFLGQVMDPS